MAPVEHRQERSAGQDGSGPKFSIRTLLVLTTVCCAVFAVPGGYTVLAAAAVWLMLAAPILWLLWRFRRGIHGLLSGQR
ncbi:MAG: hypothetical protein AAGA92_05335 [Planctomycetota bacterium]